MKERISTREANFKTSLQKVEREIMSTFAFERNMALGTKIQSTMTETMTLEGDYVVMKYATEFDGADLREIAKKIRMVDPKFSDDQEHIRDV